MQTRKAASTKRTSTIMANYKASGMEKDVSRKKSYYLKGGKVTSSQHLLAINAEEDANKLKPVRNASELYLPEQMRVFKKREKKPKK